MDATTQESQPTEKLFRNAEDALRFAYRYSMHQQGRSLADRLAAPAGRLGRGLSGNDGAAQAGILQRLIGTQDAAAYLRGLWDWAKTVFSIDEIRQIEAADRSGIIFLEEVRRVYAVEQEVEHLTTIEKAVIVARFSPRSFVCSCGRACCSGYTPNPVWEDAIRTLTHAALGPLSGRLSHYQVRRKLVEEVFGVKVKLVDLHEKTSVNKNTITEHRKLIRVWLSGQKAQPAKGKREALAAVTGIETSAREKIDRMLSYLDFIGES